MPDYVTLMGAEQVQSAGHAIRSAAEEMSRAAGTIQDAMFRFEQLVQRIEAAAAERMAESVERSQATRP